MTRRVAVVCPADSYVGPDLARLLVARDHDVVLGDATPELADELEAQGASVTVVEGVQDLAVEGTAERLVDAALGAHGRIDAACCFTGAIIIGRFLDSTPEQLAAIVRGNIEAPYRFLRAVGPPMVEAASGQILVITSASAARPTPGAALYSATRAGATHLVRNVADELAPHGVQVNAVGTNFMDFPGFIKANRADDPERRTKLEAMVPMRRLGTMPEFAAFCSVFLDGTSRFQTGVFVPYAGGWA
jgi:3-oxoacyl-[acyl-carrier protein] reductase